MPSPDKKIIVFDSFDNVIRANLAKLKLDAYGIPCFLTDENFVGLYPIRNEVFPGVRLHIFEQDVVRVKEILAEDEALRVDEGLHCPQCHSTHITVELQEEKSSIKKLFYLLSAVVMAPLDDPEKKKYSCRSCRFEFSA